MYCSFMLFNTVTREEHADEDVTQITVFNISKQGRTINTQDNHRPMKQTQLDKNELIITLNKDRKQAIYGHKRREHKTHTYIKLT